MKKETKIKKDEQTLKKYERQLRNRRKEYQRFAEAYSKTGRRNRALAVGECALKAMDALRELNAEKTLLEGTLFWTINEERIRDTDGIKGFRYVVCWHVKSDEDYYTEEEIRKEIEDTRARMLAETEEMYAEEKAEE